MKRLLVISAALLFAWMPVLAQTGETASADGWYRWQIVDGESAGMMLYMRRQQDKTVRIAVSEHDCGIPRHVQATDLGDISTDDAVSMLREIVMNDDLDQDVREQAMFGLAQSGSDRAFDTLNRLIFGG
ncbi:MAG: hypothetical protein QNJ11_02820 [Woeseiaceae bacterium]|nr:hypothetical protein [Woeseiaceae bacterium]